MGWILLVGFMLLFSAFTFTSSEQYSFATSDGGTHHILVPEVSFFDNYLDELTNDLLIKYENPWDNTESTFDIIGLISLVGISILILPGIVTFSKTNPPFRSRLSQSSQKPLFHFIHIKNLKKIINKSKNKFLPKLFVVFFVVLLFSPLAFDSAFAVAKIDTIAKDDFQSCTSVDLVACTTPDITTTAGDIIVVAVSIIEAGGTLASTDTIDFNAGSETLAGGDFILQQTTTQTGNADIRIQIYEASTPTSATGNIDVVLDATGNDFAVGVWVISGAAQQSYISDGGASGTVSDTPSDTITPTDTNSLVLGVVGAETDRTAATANGGGTLETNGSVTPASGVSLAAFSSDETGNDNDAETRGFSFSGGTATSDSLVVAFEIQGSTFDLTPTPEIPIVLESATIAAANTPSEIPIVLETTTMVTTLTPTEIPVVLETSSLSVSQIASDTPIVLETAPIAVSRPASDTPIILESTTLVITITASDTPAVLETTSNLFPRSASDTPIVLEPTTIAVSLTASDTPTVLESATYAFPRSASDTPVVLEPTTIAVSLSATDTPAVLETTTIAVSQVASDTPAVLELATYAFPRPASDTPAVLETTTIAATITSTDTPAVIETVTTFDPTSPTFTAARTGTNTIALTFSEKVDSTTTAGEGYSVSGGTVTANTDPDGTGNVMTLTTSGITDTAATPTVTYSRELGTTIDATPLQNEVADGFIALATDGVRPTFVSATIVGNGDLNVIYSESVTSTNTAHYTVEWPDTNGVTVDSVFGSGTKTILLDTSATDPEGNDIVDLSITTDIVDLAGNNLQAAVTNNIINPGGDAFVQPVLTTTNEIVLSTNTLITTITATAVEPEIILTGLAGAAGTATFPSTESITVDTANADIIFPKGVTASNLPADEIIEISVTTRIPILPSGQVAGTIIELGDPAQDIGFDSSIRVVLTGQGGKTPFIINAAGATEQVSICSAQHADSAAADASADITNGAPFDDECAFTLGSDLVFYTEHFSGFGGSSSAPSSNTSTSTTGGSTGGSTGDTIPPSITVGFEANEFPLKYDGVNYEPYQLDMIHTAIIETGEELKSTLTLYDNSGASNIRHVEMYVNQFGSRILNDLSETIVIYDEQTGLEIIDPHNLIATANVIPSVSGTKAVFDFEIVFEDAIPESDVLFRIWDIKRNSMQLHLPNSLIVEGSPLPSKANTIEPKSEVAETQPETITPESIIPETITPETATETPKESPEILDSTPESQLSPKTWTGTQLSVLKQWAGYDVETASDIEVLDKFGIKGEIIPSWFKQSIKWVLKDEMNQEEFVNALQYMKKEGMLSNSVNEKSFEINTQEELEEFRTDSTDNKAKFEFDENKISLKANFEDLEYKIRTLRALANNVEIQNTLVKSNVEFANMTDVDDVISQRESVWQRNPQTVTPLMESLMDNDSALIAKTIIENDQDDLIPLMSIVITNSYGVNIVMTEKTVDYKQSDDQWWQTTKENSVYIMSGSSSEEYTSLYTAEISTVINDKNGNFVGIIKAVVNFEKALLSD